VPVLKTEGLTKVFGGLTAVLKCNIEINRGELIGLIGPNGAGKTTLFNLLTGITLPTSGTVELEGKKIQGLRPHVICKNGIARTFQNIRLFKDLTVLDNVKIAMNQHVKYGLPSAFFHNRAYRRTEAEIIEKAGDLLNIFNLYEKRDELAKNLPYGEQRQLEIARALATDPILLLLDEPAAGMNPVETAELTELIAKIRRDYDLSILLIEHDMSLVMSICERIYVLDYGVVIAEGIPEEIKSNKRVIEAYLGEEVENA
jgi:branched-chain amino acid transport system ATP-binding protein